MTSIGLGEDGPTHQPVEHLAMLRAIAEPQRLPPGRHRRDGGMLGVGAEERKTGRACWSCRARTCRCSGKRIAARTVRAAEPICCGSRAAARCHADRHRLRGRDRGCGCRKAGSRAWPRRRGRLDALLGAFRGAGRRIPARRPRHGAARRRRSRGPPGLGSLDRRRPAPSSACRALAPAPLPRTFTGISASRPKQSRKRPAASVI